MGLRPDLTSDQILRAQNRQISSVFGRERPQLGSRGSVGAENGSVHTDFSSPLRFWPPDGPFPGRISRSALRVAMCFSHFFQVGRGFPRPGLAETELKSILVAGERFHTSHSMDFSPPEPPRQPPDTP